jgi:hypothetical protein
LPRSDGRTVRLHVEELESTGVEINILAEPDDGVTADGCRLYLELLEADSESNGEVLVFDWPFSGKDPKEIRPTSAGTAR